MLLDARRSILVVVDIQERLLPVMQEPERVVRSTAMLLAGAGRLQVPVLVTEQYPRGIGHTVGPLREALPEGARVVEKLAFSGAREPAVAQAAEALRAGGRDQLVVAGIEAHVCVLQTALGFRALGYEVAVVADAVSSRAAHSLSAATARLLHAGCQWVTTEMVLFEWLERAGTEDFRALLPLIKGD
ncbi:isochorismatase family protein [Salinarimonas soli]|uniref:Isochorismatase family protein n=1 Tax=Salinarimonas soli TaxID=1638099 RepID=A0A5B2V8N4_9HYPH|nr:isochorismatase family protein [Salinarimonas soli]KAA2234689.1 isochorismatase family protein [Salinarimonas soli]